MTKHLFVPMKDVREVCHFCGKSAAESDHQREPGKLPLYLSRRKKYRVKLRGVAN